jgi:hypothetical protein
MFYRTSEFNSNRTENYKNEKDSLPPIIQLAIVLRFYATGQFQITEGDLHGRHQSTVSRLVKKVSIAIAKLKSKDADKNIVPLLFILF